MAEVRPCPWDADACRTAGASVAARIRLRHFADVIGRPILSIRALPSGRPLSFGPGDPRVRVGIVSPCCYTGGAERWISDLLDHCDGSRIAWSGVAILVEPSGGPNLKADWQDHCPVASGDRAIAALALASDVIVSWGVIDLPWGISPARLDSLIGGRPVVNVSHGSIEHPVHGEHITRAVPVAVSRPALRGLPPAKRGSARIVLNAVSPDRVAASRTRAEMLSSWGLPHDAKVAGWLGRVSPEKRPEAFVRGVAALPEGWFGVMAGSGLAGHDDACRALADAVAPGRVVALGTVEGRVGDVLGGFDCLVMPSRTEACSLAAAEGWLAGVPLVSTPVGLLEDHPELARLTSPDPTGDEIAAAILGDLADPEGTRARVDRAREFARSELSPERFGKDWTDLIRSLAVPAPGPELCDCGDDVWVGSRFACDVQAGRFDRVVHVGGCCKLAESGGPDRLAVRWTEFEPVDVLSPTLGDVVAFAKPSGRLLVHCAGGVTRSPALALAVKITRGCEPGRAIADIRAAFHRDRKIPVRWVIEAIDEILAMLAPGSTLTPEETDVHRADEAKIREYQARQASSNSVDPAVRDAVLACPHRGPEGGAGRDDSGCCGGGPELTECRAGRGARKGRVTLRGCLDCRSA